MKTILEWLNELPDEYRDKAIANFHAQRPKGSISQFNNMYDAFFCAFRFNNTPEGGLYWLECINKCTNQTESKLQQATDEELQTVQIIKEILQVLAKHGPISIAHFAEMSATIICYIHDKKSS